MQFSDFNQLFYTIMQDNGLGEFLSEDVSRKFYELTERMLEVNRSMNLTAIKEEGAVILRHYVDSLTVARFLPQNAKIADVGCGAGFPSLPLAICRPDLTVTGIDSTEKRITYVKETAKLLGLPHLTAIAMRAEDGGKGSFRESFDICTARAVAPLPVLAELCLPLVRVSGRFIAMKASRGEEELQAAGSAIKRLGGQTAAAHRILLKGEAEQDERLIIEIKKIAPSPENLPRPYAKILKKPL